MGAAGGAIDPRGRQPHPQELAAGRLQEVEPKPSRVAAEAPLPTSRPERVHDVLAHLVRIDADRAGLEPIPRHPSTVFAPADPLLIAYARSWSLSEPYLVRSRSAARPVGETTGGGYPSLPLEAIDERAGELIRLRGPELPQFLQRSG